jgi:hypothetical protein
MPFFNTIGHEDQFLALRLSARSVGAHRGRIRPPERAKRRDRES